LAKRHGINPKTVAKWKKRSFVADRLIDMLADRGIVGRTDAPLSSSGRDLIENQTAERPAGRDG
jgi:hypothetical protein